MKNKQSAELCSALYRLGDGSLIEVSYVELFDEDYEYLRSEAAYEHALNCYLSKKSKELIGSNRE